MYNSPGSKHKNNRK